MCKGFDVSLEVHVEDEILVKFKVEHVSDMGLLYAYSVLPAGGSYRRLVIHVDDVVEIIKPPILAGQIYRGNGFDQKIEAVVADTQSYAVVSIDDFIQTTLVPLSKIRDWRLIKDND